MRSAIFLSFVILLAVCASIAAQGSRVGVNDEKCAARIYQSKEVTQRPKFGPRDSPGLTPEALAHGVRGRVVVSAVLCRTGKITDVQVIEGLPFGMTERVVEAARRIEFEPAMKDGRPVSEVIRIEYEFHFIGEPRPAAKEPIAGRMIETVEFSGLRSMPSDKLMAHVKTRPGESYNPEQVAADLQSVLALGFLDPKQSRVRLEEGDRGGLVVVFELIERR